MEKLTEEQMIARLSEIHKEHSRDPETLCKKSIYQFNMDHPNIKDVFAMQPALLEICLKRGDAWTNNI
jgi:hypothetical protein